MPGEVSVPIKTEYIAECILRFGRSADVAAWINGIVGDHLDRTRDDRTIWSSPPQSANGIDQREEEAFRKKYGDPQEAYRWFPLLLPNATQIRMTYKKRSYHAEVRHEQIVYDGKSLTPSELARKIADNTNRNAWRDLWLKMPGSDRWVLADTMRNVKQTEIRNIPPEDMGL